MPDTKRTASGVLGGFAGLVGLSAVAGVLVAATVTPGIALSGAAASSAITMFDNLPSVLDIDKLMLPSTYYGKNPDTGEYVEMAKFYDQNRSPVDFDEIAPVMYDAILSSEDPRYYQHGGVDLIGTTRALLSNASGSGQTQGGSSISQQYVKNVLIQRCERDAVATDELSQQEVLQNCWTDATTASGADGYQRKLQEMRYAISLEQKYSKNDILLGYLNIANFGGVTYGIDAASRYYFNVAAKDLTLGQAATLAGIVQNPNTYRIDKAGGSVTNQDGVGFNKAPDGLIDDVREGQLAALDSALASGKITQEQYLAAADGYSATKGRQLYVLSRLLEDGKITQEQYDAAIIEPITPVITHATTGCGVAGGSAYFCQYVRDIVENDPAFGATPEDREKALKRGGLNIYTTIDYRVQAAAEQTMQKNVPTSVDWMKLGSTIVSIEATTGRVLAIAQNTQFSEAADAATNPNLSSLVFAGDNTYGGSNGFEAGSTFKLFTLIDWLEKGHSLNETVNGKVRKITKIKDSCAPGGFWIDNGAQPIKNFGGGGGQVGTPMRFTAASLNSGFLGMAEKLDLCDIQKVATKMGVVLARTGEPVVMDGAFSVIGSNSVSPLAMASAYATVANNGIYCQPRAIDRVTDSDGNEIAPPVRTCTQVIEPRIAATAAFALQGVMTGGGTGAQGNPRDDTPLIGKTGTAEEYQTWLIESSTKVATAAWVGNVDGRVNMFRAFGQLRYTLARETQRVANSIYGGDDFATPDNDLIKTVLTDLPNVVGMTIDDAKRALDEAGFEAVVGEPVDSAAAEGLVAAQSPGAGRVAGGSTVTINPSNGQGVAVPDVAGRSLRDAKGALRSAGFGNVVDGACTVDAGAGTQQKATGTTPAAGSLVNRNAAIAVDYTSATCGGSTAPGGGGNGNGNGNGNGGNG
jgi:membrane peptidoglycan carboxypeptidase